MINNKKLVYICRRAFEIVGYKQKNDLIKIKNDLIKIKKYLTKLTSCDSIIIGRYGGISKWS